QSVEAEPAHPLRDEVERRPGLPHPAAPVSVLALAQARSKPRALTPGERVWQSARNSCFDFGWRSGDRPISATRYAWQRISAAMLALAAGHNFLSLAAGTV